MILPQGFTDYLLQHWEASDVEALVQGLEGEPTVSIRINPRRLPAEVLPEGADGRVPWCPEGIYLSGRPLFTADPLFHAGAYYVQEASSMFVAHVLRSTILQTQSTFTAALDLCAAPGGKSTLLRSLLPDDCLLVSNEPVRARTQVLAENMAKWGHENVVVTQAMASDFAALCEGGGKMKRLGDRRFDLILADVPCSGEGMMRKDEEARRQWSPRLVANCAALQREIVSDAWPALRPGGWMIYSTCTFNPEEDERNVEWIARELGADIIAVPVQPEWGILNPQSSIHFCHFLPGRVRGEGFFLALLRKHGEPADERRIDGESYKKLLRERLQTLPTDMLDKIPGVTAPVPRIDLSIEDAIRYLQHESLVLPPEAPRGYVQVCFRGQRLGFVKNLGSRANNLYPKEWRIRSGHVMPHTIWP